MGNAIRISMKWPFEEMKRYTVGESALFTDLCLRSAARRNHQRNKTSHPVKQIGANVVCKKPPASSACISYRALLHIFIFITHSAKARLTRQGGDIKILDDEAFTDKLNLSFTSMHLHL